MCRVTVVLVTVLVAGCTRANDARDAAPGEPAVFREAYRHSIAALGYPGARRAFQAGHGSLVANGEVALTFRWNAPAGDTSTSSVYFERDGVPVAHWTATDAVHEVAFEAAAAPSEALGDTSLMLVLRVTATRRAPGRGRFALGGALGTAIPGPHAVPWDAPDPGGARLTVRGHVVRAGDRNAAGLPADTNPTPAGIVGARAAGRASDRIAFALAADLAAGESRAWDFWMPLYPSALEAGRLAQEGAYDPVVARSRAMWRGWLGRAASLSTPDPRIGAAWRAAIVTLVQCQERDQGRYLPIGNPFQYRDVWIRDGARVVRALAVAGLEDLARDDARSLARFQFPSGALLSQKGQLDGTGQALWAFDQATALPPSAEGARTFLPFARAAVDWIEETRAQTGRLGFDWPGLLPFANPRDNELVRAELVGNDAWAIAGLRAAAALGVRAGDSVLAHRAAAAAADYRAVFREALARTGRADVPPSWRGPGRDWGNLAVCYPTGVLDPGDPRLARLDERFLPERTRTGLVASSHPDSLHTYLGADLAEWALLAGLPAEARRWLAGILAHSSSTLGQSEVFHRTGTFGANLPPHATAAATLVDLLRNMIVCDVRDTLEIALGGDPAWWEGARMTRAPTRFGVVDVSLTHTVDGTLEARFTPVPVPVRARVPDGARVLEILTPGARAVGGYVEGEGRRGTLAFRVGMDARPETVDTP